MSSPVPAAPEVVLVPVPRRAGIPDFLIQAVVALIALVPVTFVIPQIMQPGIGGGFVVGIWAFILFFVGLGVAGVAALIGLPIRLSPGLRAGWTAHPMLPIIGLIAGAAVLLVTLGLYWAWIHRLIEVSQIASLGFYLFIALSWLAIEFFALHWWAPVTFIKYRKMYRQPS